MKKIILFTMLITASTASYAGDTFEAGASSDSSGFVVFYGEYSKTAVICNWKSCKKVPVKDSDD